MQHVEGNLKRAFESVLSAVLARYHAADHEWLVHQADVYIPDHIVFNQFGNWWQRKLNRVLADLYLTGWYRWIFPRLLEPIMQTIQHRFMPYVVAQSVHEDKFQFDREFVAYVSHELAKQKREIPLMTYTDMFWFMTDVINEYGRLHGLGDDIYAADKAEQMVFGRKVYTEVCEPVLAHPKSFELAVVLAIQANWVDSMEDRLPQIMARLTASFSELVDQADPVADQVVDPDFFQMEALKTQLSRGGQTVLYELDNHGEVWLDLLLVQVILRYGNRVILAAKKDPILNDVTVADLQEIMADTLFAELQSCQVNGQLEVISTGSRMTGQHIAFVSEAYKAAYAQADLVMLKGQGNFATKPLGTRHNGAFRRYQYKTPIWYLMVIKADLILLCLKQAFPNVQFGKGQLFLRRG